MDVLVGSIFSAAVVLRDRIVELSEPDVGRAEVRQRIGAIGCDGERGLVGVDGAEDVAGLMQLDRARQQLLGVGVGLAPPPGSGQPARSASSKARRAMRRLRLA